eukprot:Colp12_sorted_trinity150504_noHs@13907
MANRLFPSLQKAAWFAPNTDPEYAELWGQAGGEIVADWTAADYLFSSNAFEEETKRILNTTESEGNVAIFDPAYIKDKLDASKRGVQLGAYMLRPEATPKAIPTGTVITRSQVRELPNKVHISTLKSREIQTFDGELPHHITVELNT